MFKECLPMIKRVFIITILVHLALVLSSLITGNTIMPNSFITTILIIVGYITCDIVKANKEKGDKNVRCK